MTTLSTVLTNVGNWQDAVQAVLNFWIPQGRCFSSGELVTAIRLHRPDLSFSALSLGGSLRELFYSGMPNYSDEDGFPVLPVQVSRFTVGKFPTRTLAGTEVFVYGPSAQACAEHDFEVFIPHWNAQEGRMETEADAPAPAVQIDSIDSAPGTQLHKDALTAYSQRILIAGSKPGIDSFRATIKVDNRMYLGRPVFEALCHLSDTPIRASDPVWVQVEPGTKVVVTLTEQPGAKPYSLVKDRGSLAFCSGDSSHPFPVGKHYKLNITPTEICVDLTQVY